jgi:sodium-dependent phosphate transporter
MSASYIGLPVSTTHCITGATAAVALSQGNWRSLNWRMFGLIFFGWILTVPVTALIAGSVYGFIVACPSIV